MQARINLAPTYHGHDRLLDMADPLPEDTIVIATTEHAASSYGQPVVTIDGSAYGPADLTAIGQSISAIASYPPDLAEQLRRAGYKVSADIPTYRSLILEDDGGPPVVAGVGQLVWPWDRSPATIDDCIARGGLDPRLIPGYIGQES